MYEIHDLKDGTQIKAVPELDGCDGCAFNSDKMEECKRLDLSSDEFHCLEMHRTDNKDAIFKRHYRTAPAIAVKVEL